MLISKEQNRLHVGSALHESRDKKKPTRLETGKRQTHEGVGEVKAAGRLKN